MNENTHILIVEDEKQIARFLQMELEHEGYICSIEYNGAAALDRIGQEHFDLILLDIMLPDVDGLTICKRTRELSNIPIMMLSAKDDIETKVVSLDIGANDYLTKPFSVEELLARLRVTQRRLAAQEGKSGEAIFRNGNLSIDYGAGCAYLGGEPMKLTPTEFKLLCLLAKDVGKVLTHTYLTEKIWGSCWESDMASLRVHMATLRKKLEKDPDIQYIQTHIGIGYRMLKL